MTELPVGGRAAPDAAGGEEPEAHSILEAYGQTCVNLEPLIKRRMRTMQSGEVLEVRADDPTARLGIPSWCRLSGNVLLATVIDGPGRLRFFLR
jgi:TusA-related sulfurtransferase